MRLDRIALLFAVTVLGTALWWELRRPPNLSIRVSGDTAFVDGITSGRDQGAVRALLREHPQVRRLVLGDMPGTRDVVSNYRLGRTIREAGLATELLETSRIASGAVDLFLAGTTRRVACGARIGVHSWGGAGFDAQDVGWDTLRAMSRDYIADMGVDPDFYDFRTQAAGIEDIHWLTDAQIARFNVTTEPRNCS